MQWVRVILRAPMASWGGIVNDDRPHPHPIPTPSWLTGFLGAACGISWHESEQLQALQDGLEYAVIHHRSPRPLVDYQSADLSQPWLDPKRRVTHDGSKVERESSNKTGTVIQHRPLWSDVDTTLIARATSIKIAALDDALRAPVFSLYLGRGDCPLARPPAGGIISADNLEAAARAERPGLVWLPTGIGQPDAITMAGLRNWQTRRFGGICAWRRFSTLPSQADQPPNAQRSP